MVASAKLRMSFAEIQRAVARGLHAAIEAEQIKAEAVVVDRSIDQLSWSKKYLAHYFTKPSSAMHEWLAAETHAARKSRGTILNVIGPRGGAKSTIGTTANALRCAVEGTEPLVWLISETGTQAEEFLSQIREELENNKDLARDYPEACGKGKVWRANKIELRNGVVIAALSKGTKLRGRRNRQHRPSLVIVDDLQSDAAMTSDEARTKDWAWVTGALLKAGNRQTNYIFLATAIHREAVSFKLAARPGVKSRTFSAMVRYPVNMSLWDRWQEIFEDIGNPNSEAAARAFYDSNKAMMDESAIVLWPEEENLYALMRMRVMEGRTTFKREKEGIPAAAEDNEWPEEYFNADKIYFDEWPTAWRMKAMALDPSKGRDARRSDYSAYVMLMVGVDGVLYVDANLARRPTPTMIADGVELYRTFAPDAFGVEANAWQELLGGEFERAMVEQGSISTPPFQIFNTTNKQVRIRRLGPYLSQSRIKFKSGSPGVKLLISQLRDFPDKHSHDDGPDALEMAIRLADEFLGGVNIAHPSHVEN